MSGRAGPSGGSASRRWRSPRISSSRSWAAFRPWSDDHGYLFAFGARYPLEQQKSPLVTLGSVCTVKGKRGVLCIYGGGGKRMMRVDAWDGDWASVFGYLAVR